MFKKGDIVRCIDDSSTLYLKIGKVYLVVDAYYCKALCNNMVRIKLCDSNKRPFYSVRFEKLEHPLYDALFKEITWEN